MASLPLMLAAQSGVAPRSFATFAFAPARSNCSAMATSSR